MYGKPTVLPGAGAGVVIAGGVLPFTGFQTALFLALALLILLVGAVLIRVSYLKRHKP